MSLTQVYLGLGSNIDREAHLCAALDCLAEQFGTLSCSPVFESEAVGGARGYFLNMVVGLKTHLSVVELVRCLKHIESCRGRNKQGCVGLPLDIDLLLYGQQVGGCEGISLPRAEILQQAFILWPLALLAPHEVHPVRQQCFSLLWQQASIEQELWPYAMSWQQQVLTPSKLFAKAAPAQSVALA